MFPPPSLLPPCSKDRATWLSPPCTLPGTLHPPCAFPAASGAAECLPNALPGLTAPPRRFPAPGTLTSTNPAPAVLSLQHGLWGAAERGLRSLPRPGWLLPALGCLLRLGGEGAGDVRCVDGKGGRDGCGVAERGAWCGGTGQELCEVLFLLPRGTRGPDSARFCSWASTGVDEGLFPAGGKPEARRFLCSVGPQLQWCRSLCLCSWGGGGGDTQRGAGLCPKPPLPFCQLWALGELPCPGPFPRTLVLFTADPISCLYLCSCPGQGRGVAVGAVPVLLSGLSSTTVEW